MSAFHPKRTFAARKRTIKADGLLATHCGPSDASALARDHQVREGGALFPDTNSEWEGYPSIIDGIRYPYVHLIAALPGTINLLVTGEETTVCGYGVSARALLHWAVDEFEYSVTAHGLPTLAYDGTAYIKRARRSNLLQTYASDILSATRPNVQHFAFLGGDECVELVTDGELTIFPLHSVAARDQWIEQLRQEVREAFAA